MPDPIVDVRAREVVLPLPRPLQLGPMRITQRAYALVDVVTASGLVGHAYALTRDAPVVEVVERLFRHRAIGLDAGAVEDVYDALWRATMPVGRVGLVQRALSLVDIALWDVRGQRAGLPLWRLLGAASPRVPAIVVSGYPTGAPASEIGARCAELAAAGWRIQKVARFPDADDLRTVLEAAAEGGAEELVVDVAWVWRTASEAAEAIAAWPAERLAWVEDPLPPEDARAYGELRRRADVPIGAGDEVTDPFVFDRLFEHDGLDVLRLDVTTLGGFTGTLPVAARACAQGRRISFHVYPETSVHLAAAFPPALGELFDPDDDSLDPARRLYDGGPTVEPGALVASDAPGLGIAWRDA
jgi:L-alanine-DL-glutamate epimerase-like enolase superfamily enzyme